MSPCAPDRTYARIPSESDLFEYFLFAERPPTVQKLGFILAKSALNLLVMLCLNFPGKREERRGSPKRGGVGGPSESVLGRELLTLLPHSSVLHLRLEHRLVKAPTTIHI